MKIEHFALQVSEPVAMAEWYREHLGFSIARAGGEPAHARFLLEQAGTVLLEIYHNPRLLVPDYRGMNPMQLHLAFTSADVAVDRDRLRHAGASVQEDVVTSPSGDQFVMLRDPWGIPLQLVKRFVSMMK